MLSIYKERERKLKYVGQNVNNYCIQVKGRGVQVKGMKLFCKLEDEKIFKECMCVYV